MEEANKNTTIANLLFCAIDYFFSQLISGRNQ